MKKVVAWFVSIMCVCTLSALAQNKVVFDNQSGEPALVKLVGPTKTQIDVPNGAKVGAEAAAGRYLIKVRYGEPGKYHYSKGQEFVVTETATTRSETTITLHKVVGGNYASEPIPEDEFDKAGTTPVAVAKTGRGTNDNQFALSLLQAAKKIGDADQDADRLSVVGTLIGDLPFGAHTVMVYGSSNRLMLVSRGGSLYASGMATPDAKGSFKADVYRAALLQPDEDLCLTLQIANGVGASFKTESHQLVTTNGTLVVFKFPKIGKQLDVGRVMIKKQ